MELIQSGIILIVIAVGLWWAQRVSKALIAAAGAFKAMGGTMELLHKENEQLLARIEHLEEQERARMH